MPFEQKVVVITGASRGIGASLVERFRKIGYGVVANSRSIDAAGDPAVLVDGRDTAERVVNIERFGRIDTLINNAGVFIPKQFIDYSETDFATMIAVNLGGSSTSRRRQQPGCFGRVPARQRHGNDRRTAHCFTSGGPGCSNQRRPQCDHSFSRYRIQPMGRMGETQEIVDAVLYLEKGPFVTGEILHGGWSPSRS